jgi:hypothetical protein
MHIKPAFLVACAVAGLLICGARSATALSCAGPSLTAPLPDAVDVPTNTWVWCSHYPGDESSQIFLTDLNGRGVSGAQALLATPEYDLLVFRPDSGLEPNTEYRASCPSPHPWEGDDGLEFSFSTGSSSLSKAPPIPNVATVELSAQKGDDWGDSYSATFQNAGELGNIIVLNLGGSSTLNPDELSGEVADPIYLTTWRDYSVGDHPCEGNWPGATLGASTTVALGAFNLAGGFSGWSDTVTVTIPSAYTEVPDAAASEEDSEPPRLPPEAPYGPPGCQFGAPAGSLYGVAGLFATLAWRLGRRRPRQPLLGTLKSSNRADHTERNATPAER